MVNKRIHTLNMAVQAGKIKSLFPESNISFNQNRLTWKYEITPSPLSNSYDIKLTYIKGEHPNIFIENPKLQFFPKENKLPHVYSTAKQWICIYYRKGREWNSEMLIANTIIPWTCEWLLHYELWVSTGTWHGGGIHHETEAEKQANKQKEETDE